MKAFDRLHLGLLELPNEVLLMIFSKTSLKDLFRLAQVNVKCMQIVDLVWSSKKEIVFNNQCVFGSNSQLISIVKKILAKTNPIVLRSVDLSFFCRRFKNNKPFNQEFIQTIVENCSKITSLNLENYILTYDYFNMLPVNLTLLTDLNLSRTSIYDYNLTYVLNDCRLLQNLNLASCNCLKGKCQLEKLYHDMANLKSISFDFCQNIPEIWLLDFLHRYGQNLVSFMAKSVHQRTKVFYNAVTKHLNRVNHLSLSYHSSDNFPQIHNFADLVELDMGNQVKHGSSSFGLSLILKNCYKLKRLNLTKVSDLDDDLFATTEINSPLEYLNISDCSIFTDVTLRAISQKLDKSLVFLNISNCNLFKGENILNFLQSMTTTKQRRVSLHNLAIMKDKAFLDRLLFNTKFNNRLILECSKVSEFEKILQK